MLLWKLTLIARTGLSSLLQNKYLYNAIYVSMLFYVKASWQDKFLFRLVKTVHLWNLLERFSRKHLPAGYHHQLCHSDTAQVICPKCGEKFAIKQDLITHFPIHPIFKPYKCKLCSKICLWRHFCRHVLNFAREKNKCVSSLIWLLCYSIHNS